jgi:hypothetical protein
MSPRWIRLAGRLAEVVLGDVRPDDEALHVVSDLHRAALDRGEDREVRRRVVVHEPGVLAGRDRLAIRAALELLGELADVGGRVVRGREALEAPPVVTDLEVDEGHRPVFGQRVGIGRLVLVAH